jgi:hypothetical protein
MAISNSDECAEDEVGVDDDENVVDVVDDDDDDHLDDDGDLFLILF